MSGTPQPPLVRPRMLALQKSASIIATLSSRGFIIWGYVDALLHPTQSTSFIYGTAYLVFILEFLNIGVMAFSTAAASMSLALKSFVLSQVALWVSLLLFLFQQKTAILFFAASMLARIAFRRSAGNSDSWGCAVMIFLPVTFLVTFTASYWSMRFPFPQSVYDKKPPDVSGGWFDNPQVVLIWGILFFGMMALNEVLRTLAATQTSVAASGESNPPR